MMADREPMFELEPEWRRIYVDLPHPRRNDCHPTGGSSLS